MAWDDEWDRWLKDRWAEGKTAQQIANLSDGRFTRSAILGRSRRLALPNRAPPSHHTVNRFLDLVADRNYSVHDAAEAVGWPRIVAQQKFDELFERYDFGLPPTLRDDFVTPVRA